VDTAEDRRLQIRRRTAGSRYGGGPPAPDTAGDRRLQIRRRTAGSRYGGGPPAPDTAEDRRLQIRRRTAGSRYGGGPPAPGECGGGCRVEPAVCLCVHADRSSAVSGIRRRTAGSRYGGGPPAPDTAEDRRLPIRRRTAGSRYGGGPPAPGNRAAWSPPSSAVSGIRRGTAGSRYRPRLAPPQVLVVPGGSAAGVERPRSRATFQPRWARGTAVAPCAPNTSQVPPVSISGRAGRSGAWGSGP
jgi:hypothetical protein